MTRMIQAELFDYSLLDAPTRRFVQERAERIHNLARMTATSIVQIGQYLTEVKERLKHGQFLDWLDKEFAWSDWTARSFIHVFQRFKSENFSDLQIDVSALYLIAAPKTPEPVRQHVITRAQNGEVITHGGVRAAVQHYQDTGEVPEIAVDLKQLARSVRNDQRVEPRPRLDPESRERDRQLKEQMQANTVKLGAAMRIVDAVTELASPGLPWAAMLKALPQIAPDGWTRQLPLALRYLTKLSEELL